MVRACVRVLFLSTCLRRSCYGRHLTCFCLSHHLITLSLALSHTLTLSLLLYYDLIYIYIYFIYSHMLVRKQHCHCCNVWNRRNVL
jgi:hypothetical protein